MITISPPVNAPGTTIPVAGICIRYTLDDAGKMVMVNVRLFDANNAPIQTPRPIRQMTPVEQTAFAAVAATTGETPTELLNRAALPYITAAYGLTYPTT